MKKVRQITIVFLISSLGCAAQLRDINLWMPSIHHNQTRINTWAFGAGAISATSLTALYFAWYADYPQGKFHFTNDNNNWGGMDKWGHVTSSYVVGQTSYDMLRWGGLDESRSVWYGGLTGFTYLTVVEIMDGFSQEWGFSWGDMAANTAGAALFIGQQKLWQEQRMSLKFGFWPTEYPKYRDDGLLGSSWSEYWLKDYNGQTYWLSVNPASFLNNKPRWLPDWLNIAGGYGIDGFLTSTGEPCISCPADFPSQRQYYISLDLDLRRIPMKSGFWKTLVHTISFIKVPAPTVQFNSLGGTRFYWLYW